MIEMRRLKNLVIFFETILSSSIYYSQKELKHFGLEISNSRDIRTYFFKIFSNIYIDTFVLKSRNKKFELFTKIFELYLVSK